MIDLKLMAQAGHAAKLEDTDLFKLRLELSDRSGAAPGFHQAGG